MATKKVEEKKKKNKVSNKKNNINKKEDYSTMSSNEDNIKDEEEKIEEDFDEYDDEEYTEEKESKTKNDEETDYDEELEENHKKEKKSKKKKRNKSVTGDSFFEQNSEIISLVKILVVVLVVIVIVYFITAALNGELGSKKDADENIPGNDDDTVYEIQNEKILSSSIFNKKDKEYYVLLYDTEDANASYYSMIYQDYNNIIDDDVIPMFWVDLNDKLNSAVIAKDDEDSNTKAQKVSNLKIKGLTLIRIRRGKNVNYYENDEVIKKLKEIIADHQE